MIPVGQESDPRWKETCGALRYQRKLIQVDTRKKTISVLDAVLMEGDARYNPMNQRKGTGPVPLAQASKETASAVSRITAIIEKETK
jgi:hypothetical protein